MVLSKPIKSYGLIDDEKLIYKGFWRKWNQDENFPERAGHKIKAHFDFKTSEGENIMIKFALSAVSTRNALENLEAEIPGWDFNKVKDEAKARWNKELSKIQIEGSEDRKVNFYTAMYHSFLAPIVYSDVNGEYRGLDQNIYNAKNFYRLHNFFFMGYIPCTSSAVYNYRTKTNQRYCEFYARTLRAKRT